MILKSAMATLLFLIHLALCDIGNCDDLSENCAFYEEMVFQNCVISDSEEI
jgi:hypothetical protein